MADDAQLYAVLGIRGHGKSEWAKRLVKKARPPRFLVMDITQEDWPGGTTDLASLIRTMETKPRWNLVFYPSEDKKVRAGQFELLCKALMVVSTKEKPVWALFEEMAFFTTASWAPDGWQAITLRGRHRGLTVIGTSQRPASIDKDFLGNATFIHSATLGYEPDAKAVAFKMRCKAEELLALEKLHYLERGEMDKTPKKGVLTFGRKVAPLEDSS